MGEETVMEVVYKLRDNGIPSSAIWSEDWAGGQWTELGWYLPVSYAKLDRSLYPNAEGVADEMHDLGYRWLSYYYPNVAVDDPEYDSAASQGYLLGDQNTTWEQGDGLPAVLPAALSASFSGIPIFTHDIAGYFTLFSDTPRELFFRWTSLGAFSPVMRTHHGNKPGGWKFDSDAETLDFYRNYARMHTQLFPYLYTMAHEAVEKGTPIIRPLYFHYPDDAGTIEVEDEFLLGRNILVAPVVEKGATSREVYFPEGSWVHLLDPSQIHTGPASRVVDAPIESIPVFLKPGGIVPLLPETIETLASESNDDVTGLDDVRGQEGNWVSPLGDGEFIQADGTRYVITRDMGTGCPSGVQKDGTPLAYGEPEAGEEGWTCPEESGRMNVRVNGDSFLLEFLDPAGSVRFTYTLMDSPFAKEVEIKIIGIHP